MTGTEAPQEAAKMILAKHHGPFKDGCEPTNQPTNQPTTSPLPARYQRICPGADKGRGAASSESLKRSAPRSVPKDTPASCSIQASER